MLDAELTGITEEIVAILGVLFDAVRAGTGNNLRLTLYLIGFYLYFVAFAAVNQPARRDHHVAKKRVRLSCLNIVIIVVGREAG